MSKEQERFKLEETLESEALLLGRVTYEGSAGAWPDRGGEFADKMNAMPKYVASTTLRKLEWSNSALIEGDLANAVAELKQEDGGKHPRRRQPDPRALPDGARAARLHRRRSSRAGCARR